MAAHQVGDEILLLAHGFCQLIKALLERLICFDMRLAHFIEHMIRAVLRCDLELSGDMIPHELAEKLVILVSHQIVIADAGADEYALVFRQRTQFPQQTQIFLMIDGQIFAGFGC